MHSYPIYQDYQQKAEPLAEVLCRRLVPASVSIDNQTERRRGRDGLRATTSRCSACRPRAGRVFNSAEDDQVFQGHPVVVLSYDYWVSRFARDPGVVGKKILVNNYPMTIVGVSAAGFAGHRSGAVAADSRADPDEAGDGSPTGAGCTWTTGARAGCRCSRG